VFFSYSSPTNSSGCPFILRYVGVGQSTGEIRAVWLTCKYWSSIFYKNHLVGECCMQEAMLYWRSQLCSHHCSWHFFCPASCRCSNMMGIHNSVYYLNEGTHNAPNLNRQKKQWAWSSYLIWSVLVFSIMGMILTVIVKTAASFPYQFSMFSKSTQMPPSVNILKNGSYTLCLNKIIVFTWQQNTLRMTRKH